MSLRRRTWLFERQGGRCYLMHTNECRQRDGVMRLPPPCIGSYASWEHVIPKDLKPSGAAALKLLACCDCNSAKANSPPKVEHVELALSLSREWFAMNLRRRPQWRLDEIASEIDEQVAALFERRAA